MKSRNRRFNWLQFVNSVAVSTILGACDSTPVPAIEDEVLDMTASDVQGSETPSSMATNGLELLSSMTLTGVNDPDALTFSPDGSEVALATTEGDLRLLTVNVYSTATGELNRKMNNSTLETTTLNGGTFSDVFWGQDGVITAVIDGSSRLFWASDSGDLIADVQLDLSDPCVAPYGFAHLFDPTTNVVIDNTGENLVDVPFCIFDQSNQTVTAATIEDTPGKIGSALFDTSGDTFWVNYLERDNFSQRVSVGTLEYENSTLMPTGDTLSEGEALAITDTYRLIEDNSDYFLYPGARELAIRDVSKNRDPMNKVVIGKVPSNTTHMRFIALDDVTIVGDLPKDFGGRSTFSHDGSKVAVPYIGKIEVYDVTGRVQDTALLQL